MLTGQRVLRLEVREFLDLTRWRWVLIDSSGSFVADHEVRLDASRWEYEAFGDLRGYLRWHCAPDRWAGDEARIVGAVGAWIGSDVLGPAVGAALAVWRSAAVRVAVPLEAAELLYRPLEPAHANGRSLAVQDVTLVMEADGAAADAGPVGERLRVLGLFSLPESGRALNLRRERAELVRLVRAIAANGKAADIRVLQYGVTRDRLREVLEEAGGWDIVHVSGHGRPGSLTLETASGAPDRVTALELAGLLEPAREHLKLVTVAACWSAAVLAAQELMPGERDLFWFLCCLAEPDRTRNVLDNNWGYLWEGLGRTGQRPGLEHALDRLIEAGLIAGRPASDPDDESYPIHPGIAAAGRRHAGRRFSDVADAQLAWYWDAVFGAAGGQSDAGVDADLMLQAATSAVPYMLRQKQWDRAAALIEGSLMIDSSRAGVARLPPRGVAKRVH